MQLAIFLCKLAAIAKCLRTFPFSGDGSTFNLVTPFGAELWHYIHTFFIKAYLGAQRCYSSSFCWGYRSCHFEPNLTWPDHFLPLPQQKQDNSHILWDKLWSDQGLTCADPQEKNLRKWRCHWVSFAFMKFHSHWIFCFFQSSPVWLFFCSFH